MWQVALSQDAEQQAQLSHATAAPAGSPHCCAADTTAGAAHINSRATAPCQHSSPAATQRYIVSKPRGCAALYVC